MLYIVNHNYSLISESPGRSEDEPSFYPDCYHDLFRKITEHFLLAELIERPRTSELSGYLWPSLPLAIVRCASLVAYASVYLYIYISREARLGC